MAALDRSGVCHQQPEVNSFDVLEKGDFPSILNPESLVFRGNRPIRNAVNSSLLIAGGGAGRRQELDLVLQVL